jgi:hypothetical protein
VALDPCGRSRGFLSGWNPTFVELSALDTHAGIYLEGRIKQLVDMVKMLNCYAPYKDRELFWNTLLHFGLLHEDGIIVGEDLNFTLSTREVWGATSRLIHSQISSQPSFKQLDWLMSNPQSLHPLGGMAKLGQMV